MGVPLWSTTVGDNDDADIADGVDWREGQLPSTVNNSGRAMMKGIAELLKDLGGTIVSTGSTNEYTITTNAGYSALAENMVIVFEADKTSSGAATATIDELTQKSIFRWNGTATLAGDIVDGGVYFLVYNSGLDGFVGLNIGANLGLHTHSIPGPDWRPTITNGAGRSYTETSSNKHIEDTVDFDTTTQEFACAIWNPPKKYNGGTFTFRVKCLLAGASSTQTVDFGLSAAFVRDDDANDASFGTVVVVTDTFIAATDLHIGPVSTAVTPAGTYAAGCKIALKLQRNVSTDNAAGDARVVSVEIFWTSNAADDT